MIDIILDTNIFLSAFLFGGQSKIILELVITNKLHLYYSQALTQELFKKLHQFNASEKILHDVRLILKKSTFTTPTIQITVCRDPKDNFLLELAESVNAKFLITRDKDLLYLVNHKWKNTKIMKPEDFLPILRSMELID